MLSDKEYILEIEYMEAEYMQGVITEAENEILKKIALSGIQTRYQLFKVAADSTVHRALKKLQKLRLIEVKKEEEFDRTGKMKRYYGLTLLGLIAALKVAGVRLDLVQNREELVSSWVERVKKIDSESKVSQMFDLTEPERKAICRDLEEFLIRLMRNPTKETEKFLRHFDIWNCDDELIFHEWVWTPYLACTLYGLSKRQVKR